MLTIFILLSAVCCIASASRFVGPTYSQGYYGPRRVGQSIAQQYSQGYNEPRLIGQSIRPIYSQDYYGPTQHGQSLAPQYSQSYYEPNGLGQSYLGRGYEDRSYVENTAWCHSEMVSGNTGTIRHTYYGSYEDCTWIITATVPIKIIFDKFALEDGGDFLELRDGANSASPLLGTFTGFNLPSSVETSQNSAYLRFTSDLHGNYAGFGIHWVPKGTIERTDQLSCPNIQFSICWPRAFCIDGQDTLCDGKVGCSDSYADETDYACDNEFAEPPYCTHEWIRCSNFWNHTCWELIGQGTSYCPDEEDLLPDIVECGNYGRYCDAAQGGKCFTENQMCNGVCDCEDGTDEDLCNENFYGPTERTFPSEHSEYYKTTEWTSPKPLQSCRDICDNQTKCSAFHYSYSYQYCQFVEFLLEGPPHHIPTQTLLDYKGYTKLDIFNSKYGITGPYDEIWGYDTCKWTKVEGSNILLPDCIANCVAHSRCDGLLYNSWDDEEKGPLCVRVDCLLVPLPDGDPTNLSPGLKAYAIHKVHLWNGPYVDRKWDSSKCEPINDNAHQGDLKNCKQQCQATTGCNAMNTMRWLIPDGSQDPLEECFFMKCPHPIPYPDIISLSYNSYSLTSRNG